MKENPKAPYEILYEDDEVIAVYKKRDVFSVATEDKATYTHNLFHYLKGYLAKKNENLFLVHRLDYETSGVMVFAKSPEKQASLKKCFEERRAGRYYEAVVQEKIPLGTKKELRQFITEKGSTSFLSDEKTGKEALTTLTASNFIQIGTALAIEIGTGRHNQIRLALHSLNWTLLGDKRYAHNENKRMYLNAYKLVFPANLGLKCSIFETKPLWIIL
jgi:23S rRNA pseudouridine1911/1915/1917 synthase